MILDFALANELEDNSDPLPFFNEQECTETLQSLTNNKKNKDIMHDVLR